MPEGDVDGNDEGATEVTAETRGSAEGEFSVAGDGAGAGERAAEIDVEFESAGEVDAAADDGRSKGLNGQRACILPGPPPTLAPHSTKAIDDGTKQDSQRSHSDTHMPRQS